MNIEEAGLGEVKSCEDVPEENRITEIRVRLDMQKGKAYLKLGRIRNSGQHLRIFEPVTEVYEEVLDLLDYGVGGAEERKPAL